MMPDNNNVIFKTSASKTIDDLYPYDDTKIALNPGTIYFTADGHILYDTDDNKRLWMGKEAYSAIYAKDIDATNDIASQTVEYIEGTQTSATASWTGVTKSTSIYDKKIILYKLPVAGSGSASLTLTLADGSQTAAIPIYFNNDTRVTTHYAAKSIIIMVYEADTNRWRAHGQYNSTYTVGTGLSLSGTSFSVKTADLYWADENIATSKSYITTPEVKSIKINGSTTNSASTTNVTLVYNTATKALDFNFV